MKNSQRIFSLSSVTAPKVRYSLRLVLCFLCVWHEDLLVARVDKPAMLLQVPEEQSVGAPIVRQDQFINSSNNRDRRGNRKSNLDAKLGRKAEGRAKLGRKRRADSDSDEYFDD